MFKGVLMLRILLLSLCLSGSVFAENKKQKNAYEERKGNVDVGVARSSSVNRRDKTIGVNVGAGFESVTATFSIAFNYIVDENLMIELRASDGENTTEATPTDEVDSFSSVSLGIKYFTTDSFYIKPAFEYIDARNDEDGVSEVITGNGFSFTIGNQWQYRNLTIGVDWVGAKHIISASELENDADRTHLTFAGFYVGTTF